VTVTYTLNDDNELRAVIEAETDAATPVNFAQHSYFNLNGQARDTILNHILQING
jgi:aldose 1-epimerase